MPEEKKVLEKRQSVQQVVRQTIAPVGGRIQQTQDAFDKFQTRFQRLVAALNEEVQGIWAPTSEATPPPSNDGKNINPAAVG